MLPLCQKLLRAPIVRISGVEVLCDHSQVIVFLWCKPQPYPVFCYLLQLSAEQSTHTLLSGPTSPCKQSKPFSTSRMYKESREGVLCLLPRIGGLKAHRPFPPSWALCSIVSQRSLSVVFGVPLWYFRYESLGLTICVSGNHENFPFTRVKRKLTRPRERL